MHGQNSARELDKPQDFDPFKDGRKALDEDRQVTADERTR